VMGVSGEDTAVYLSVLLAVRPMVRQAGGANGGRAGASVVTPVPL
jgi:hypothetical protein